MKKIVITFLVFFIVTVGFSAQYRESAERLIKVSPVKPEVIENMLKAKYKEFSEMEDSESRSIKLKQVEGMIGLLNEMKSIQNQKEFRFDPFQKNSLFRDKSFQLS